MSLKFVLIQIFIWGTAKEKNEVHFHEFIHGKNVNSSTLKKNHFLTTEPWKILHSALIRRPAIIIYFQR
jgi:hypothetical protein